MEKFKIVMGFPMLATGIWLFSILGRHYGQDGVLWIGLFLVFLALAAWIWGEFVQRGRKRKGLGMAACAAVLAVSYFLLMEKQLRWRDPVPVRGTEIARTSAGGIAWQTWSPEAVEKARAEGHPVFVDFTADWCLTCKVNEQVAIERPEVRDAFAKAGVIVLRGDWTRRDPAITRYLTAQGAAGVPLYVWYPAGGGAPQQLPQVLTPNSLVNLAGR
jgi:thiol:disulfide interchange protein DsbD